MTEIQRIKIAITTAISLDIGKNQAEIGRKMGYTSASSFSQVLNGKVPIPSNFVEKLRSLHSDINKLWIEGNTNNDNPSINNDRKGVPYYDIDFVGGFDLVFNNNLVNPAFYIDFLPFNDADYWVNVSGKSMGPLIAHGDIVALKEVPDWKRFLLEGEIYAVITDNGFRTIKMIGKGPDKEHYMLIPYNKGGDYQPQEIPKEVITHVFRVKGAIKKFF